MRGCLWKSTSLRLGEAIPHQEKTNVSPSERVAGSLYTHVNIQYIVFSTVEYYAFHVMYGVRVQ